MVQTPGVTPEQAVRVLRILGEWTRRRWSYRAQWCSPPLAGVRIYYSNPDPQGPNPLMSYGVDNYDALCQATTVMQVLLEEHPEKP